MKRGCRNLAVPVLLSLLPFCPQVVGAESTLSRETSLRSEPGNGARTAFVTPETAVEVLERRGDWVRVRIEGWVPADAVSAPPGPVEPPPPTPPTPPPVPAPEPITRPPAPAAPPPVPAPARPAASGVAVEGLIKLKLGRLKKRVAAGGPVMLVPATAGLGREPIAKETAERLAELEAELARIDGEIATAMQRTNFTEATRARNELRRERRGVLEDWLQILVAEHGRHEHTARAAAVASGVTDSKGFFRLTSVPPGTYTLYARMTRDDLDLEWIEPLEVGSAPVRFDLDEARARGMLPKSSK